MIPNKYKLLFVFLFLLDTNYLVAQISFDSVKVKVASISNDNLKILFLNDLVFNNREKDTKLALEIALYADSLARVYQDERLLTTSTGNLGWIHYRLGNYKEAYNYSVESYKLALTHQQYEEASMALNNIGSLYVQIRSTDEAIQAYKEAYYFGTKKESSNYSSVRSLNNITNLYIQTLQLDSAIYFLNLARSEIKNVNSPYLTGFLYRLEGDIYKQKNDYDQALESYLVALDISKKNNLKSFSAQLLHRIGKVYQLRGEYLMAIEYLNQGEDLCINEKYIDELLNTYKNLASVYGDLGSFKKAYSYQILYNQYFEDLQDSTNLNKFTFLKSKFESEKSELNAQYFQAENKIKALKLENAERLILLGVAFIIIFIFLIIWLVLLNRKLKSINVYLDDDRKILNRQKGELEVLSKDLQQVNQTKNLLFSILSHDLRNPVSQLKGIFELLQEDVISKNEFDEISKLLKRNVDGLYSNLDNILVWSKSQLEGFKVEKSEISLRVAVQKSVEFYDSLAEDKNLSFEIDLDDRCIYADPLLLQSVVRNLVNNAIKYSRRNGIIRIDSESDDKIISLRITDSGIGIEKEKISLILGQSFNVLESSVGTEKETGTGLGLNICKQLLNLIDGQLHIESELGLGTSVYIILNQSGFNSNQ